jgi:hypothetical protein
MINEKVHCALGSAHSRARPSGPAPLGILAHDRQNRGESPLMPMAYRPNPTDRQSLVDGEATWEQTRSWRQWRSGGGVRRWGGWSAVVGSVGEVGEHLRARVTLQVGSMGPEEHRRRWSTVAGEAEEAVAGDELVPGPEVLGVNSSGVLHGEG